MIKLAQLNATLKTHDCVGQEMGPSVPCIILRVAENTLPSEI